MKLHPATPADAADIAALGVLVADDLTGKFGKGHWSSAPSERGIQFSIRRGAVFFLHRRRGKLIAMLALATRKPWAIDVGYFTPVARPLYLTGMAVLPSLQGKGLGREALVDAVRVAREWPADAIRLDAYDAEAGAGGFYARCGYAERGRVTYRNTPLVYFELLVSASSAR